MDEFKIRLQNVVARLMDQALLQELRIAALERQIEKQSGVSPERPEATKEEARAWMERFTTSDLPEEPG